jgi:hypothetical protein
MNQPQPQAQTPEAAAVIQMPVVRPRTRIPANTIDLEPSATLKLILSSIAHPPQTSLVFTITPEIASYIIENHNVGNRGKRFIKIKQYAADMTSDDWQMTGEPLKFSDLGLLRDGQNRLYACVESGKSFKTHIIFGLPDTSFQKMDQGAKRSGGDVLQIAGYTDTNNLSAAIRWVWLIDSGRVKLRQGLEPSTTLHLLQTRYQSLPDNLKTAGRIYQTYRQPKGLMAALFYHFNKLNPDKAQEWAGYWESGQENAKTKSIQLATKKLKEIDTISSGRVNDVVRAALLIIAWNMFVTKKAKVGDMQWTRNDPFPEIESGV